MRITLVSLAVGVTGLHHGPAAAAQGDYPNHPIRLIVGFAAGGNTDLMARMTAEQLSRKLGQSVVVENRGGAGGTLAAAVVAKAAPDGYTLLYASTGHAISAVLYKKLPFDTIKDFQPVAPVVATAKILAVTNSMPVHTVKEYIDYAKAHPGEVTVPGSLGSSAHFAGVLFDQMAGIKTLLVPYKGTGEEMKDLISGQIMATVNAITAYIPVIQSGNLRALGVGSAQRVPSLPNVPTISEAGLPGYEVADWGGVIAPAGTPPEIVNKLNKAINEFLRSPDIIKRLGDMGSTPMHETPEEYSQHIARDIEKFEKLRVAAGLEKQ
jgi:tripartite-type tricarboxylate transporter receptor subunit TctC